MTSLGEPVTLPVAIAFPVGDYVFPEFLFILRTHSIKVIKFVFRCRPLLGADGDGRRITGNPPQTSPLGRYPPASHLLQQQRLWPGVVPWPPSISASPGQWHGRNIYCSWDENACYSPGTYSELFHPGSWFGFVLSKLLIMVSLLVTVT